MTNCGPAQPKANLLLRLQTGRLTVQLQEDLFGGPLARGTIAEDPSRNAEHHRLVLQHDLVKALSFFC
jgi:hypothetical protein